MADPSDPTSEIVEMAPPTGDRRGPLRPVRLSSVRTRRARRLAARTFRLTDVVALALVAVGCIAAATDGTFGSTPLGDVAPVLVGAWAVGAVLRSAGCYRFGRREPAWRHFAAVLAAGFAGWVVHVSVDAVLGERTGAAVSPTVWAGISVTVVLVLHAGWWTIVRRWRAAGILTPNVVIVGATTEAERFIAEALERRDINVLGVFDDRLARSPAAIRGVPVLGDTRQLLDHRVIPYVDRIVVAIDPAGAARPRQVVARLAGVPNEVTLAVNDHAAASRAALDRLADSPLAPLGSGSDPDRRAFFKRAQDLVLGVGGLVLLAPVLAVIAVAVRLDSPGPVFFRQRRHGFHNEEIVVWKFRSMNHHARDDRAEQQVTAGDDRVTRLGRLLRSTSLDELPQLVNVVRGEMSLVGPRPHAIGMKTGDVESARLIAEYAQRHRTKPGMTGWAAIKGSRGPLPTADDVRRRVALDIEYIERQSFWLDVWIIVMTLPSVLGDRTAVR